ncbi:MAG: hypothetical protein Q8882_00540 [Bacillota bacterium]|nr:hypothetical protein [Bacillota bacterium]
MGYDKIIGTLPDPFMRKDGTRVKDLSEWKSQREVLLKQVIDLEYDGMPPKPEFVKVVPLSLEVRGFTDWYKIYAGTKDKQISFLLELNVPRSNAEKFPVVLTGDMCYHNCEEEVINEGNRRGYIVARFNRLEIAPDMFLDPEVMNDRNEGIYLLYPEGNFSAISAWAWGYQVVMDAFKQISYVDETEVGITGHSRGGKTVLLAAATDERIKYVCPNNSGTHGCACYRYQTYDYGPNNTRSEHIEDMFRAFPYWMGKGLKKYIDKEEELPHDMHFLGALIAPRYYLQCEGMQDYWINPKGSWQTFMAVKDIYRHLGCEDNAAAWFRPGFHRHNLPDFSMFMDFMDSKRNNKPLPEHLAINPYPDMEKAYSWR